MGLQQLLTNTTGSLYQQSLFVHPNSSINPRSIGFGGGLYGFGTNLFQPYIQKPFLNYLPEELKNPIFYTDSIIRGGILAPIAAAEDTVRLTKYLTDPFNPSGIIFTGKQYLLSKISTKTESSPPNPGQNGGTYDPTSPLQQSALGFLGYHAKKQISKTYLELFEDKNTKITIINNNRLYNLTSTLISGKETPFKGFKFLPNSSTLIQYEGGPESYFGVGKTNIKFATSNNSTPLKTLTSNDISNGKFNENGANYTTWGTKFLFGSGSLGSLNYSSNIIEDFREKLKPENSTVLSISPPYINKNIENRIGLNNPGKIRNISNYDLGSIDLSDTNKTFKDNITSYPIYKSGQESDYYLNSELSDLIPFYIAILNNDIQGTSTYKKYMHFRAFIDNFSETYNADWKSIEYMGRGEKFYKYGGFDRKISMAFTVAAQSRNDINNMYSKLNFLASSLAPEYLDSNASGYMTGNIAYITLGGYLYEQPGVITSLTYDIPEESPWEIGIDIHGNDTQGTTGGRKIIRQLPHIIRVQLQFIPIHKFRPEKVVFENDRILTQNQADEINTLIQSNKLNGNKEETYKIGDLIPGSVLLKNPGPQLFIDQRRVNDIAPSSTKVRLKDGNLQEIQQ